MAEGRVDAGPLALADCLRLEGTVTRLPFGIVGPTRAQSVLLFSDRPMAELGGRRIAVTGETSTSVRLLRILLAFRYEVPAPILVGLDEPADAALLIGDAALRLRQGPWPRRLCYDLGEEWTDVDRPPHGLRGLGGPPDTRRFRRGGSWRRRSRTRSRPASRASRRSPRGGATSDSPRREIAEYLRSFTYRIGPDEEKAVAEYRRLLALLEG